MRDVLAIIGSHPRTREAFDFDRTDCDVWLFNEAVSNKANAWAKRADVVFQMHVPAIWRNPKNRNDPHHYDWLKSQTDTTVYMQDVFEDVPASKKFPIEGVLDMLSGDPDHFLSSSVPQAIALACYNGTYKRIEIYGVAMETNTEWQFQREGVAFWKGFAMGKGIEVYFADPTFRCPLYGYEGEVVIPYEKFGERIAELEPQIAELTEQYKAALQNTAAAINAFEQSGGMEVEKNLFASVAIQAKIGEQLGMVDGARQENEKYKSKADTMRAASGGEFIFSRQEFESGAKNLSDRVQAGMLEKNSIGTTMDIIHGNVMRAAKGSPKRKKVMEGYRHYIFKYLQTNNQTAIYKGAASENFQYMSYLDKRIRAAGGSKSEAVLLESMSNVVAV